MELSRTIRGQRRLAFEVLYVAVVVVLTTIATSDRHFTKWAWIGALLLSLPALLAMLPVFYVTAATAWNVTGAGDGGTMWPVTATYVVLLALAAVLNVIRCVSSRRLGGDAGSYNG